MSITVKWVDHSQSAILCQVEGYWTWQEVVNAYQYIMQLTTSVSHTVDYIVDLSSNPYPPVDVYTRADEMRSRLHFAPNSGNIIIVGTPPFKINHAIMCVPSLQEALACPV